MISSVTIQGYRGFERFQLSGLGREAALYAASAFYFGGLPASALLSIRSHDPDDAETDACRACFDLLGRPRRMRSELSRNLIGALRGGDMATLQGLVATAAAASVAALQEGPNTWIPARLLDRLVQLLTDEPDQWRDRLGRLVFENTLRGLS